MRNNHNSKSILSSSINYDEEEETLIKNVLSDDQEVILHNDLFENKKLNGSLENRLEVNHQSFEIDHEQKVNKNNRTNKSLNTTSDLGESQEFNYKNEEIVLLEIPSYFDLFTRLSKIAVSICYSMIIMDLRVTSLYIFTKEYGIDVVEALSSLIGVYVIMVFGFSWAFNQGYGFLSAQHASNKNYTEIGHLTNKAFFINVVLGCIFSFIMFFFMGPIFSSVLTNANSIRHLDVIFKALSLGVPLHLMQTVLLRYFCAVDHTGTLIYASTFAFITQLVSLFITVYLMKWVDVGIGLSFTLGNFAMFLTNFYIYLYKNPHPEVLIPFKLSEVLEGLWSYIQYSVGPALLIFLTLLSYQIVPFLAIMLGDTIFSTYGILQTILNLSYMFTEALAAASNILVNYAIGERNMKKLIRILVSCGILITIYTIIISVLLIFFDYELYGIFTNVTSIRVIAHSLKVYFIVVSLFIAYHSFILETLTALGEKLFPIYSVLFGRYLVIIGFSLLFIKYFDMGAKSIFISIIIGQGIIIIANTIYIYAILLTKDIAEIAKENEEIH
jgi:Na+-driven multidrug efflux pump